MAQTAATVKKVLDGTGGNAPFILFEDADLDRAVEGAIASKFRNAGQTCVCTNRIYVHRSVYAEFSKRLTTAVQGLRIGDGSAEGVPLGALIPVDVRNALAVGRGISATRTALSALRIMSTVMLMGQAAGVVAAQASSGDTPIRDVPFRTCGRRWPPQALSCPPSNINNLRPTQDRTALLNT